MKVIATILSLSFTATTILPAAAFDVSSSDRASWIEQTLSGSQAVSNATTTSTKKTSTTASSSNQSSITSTSGKSLANSVSGLFPGVKIRPFIPNRYLPSEHDIELAQQQAIAAQLQPQSQLHGNVSYTGSYTNQVNSVRPRMVSMQSRLNALAPSIPEPVTSNETVAQIRSSLKNAQGNQLIASASAGNNNGYSANLCPDLISPVPTQGNASSRAAQSPMSFLPQHSTRQLSAYTSSSYKSARSASLTPATLGGWRTQRSSGQTQQLTTGQTQQRSSLSYGGFQSYSGKVHVQSPAVGGYGQTETRSIPQTQSSARTTYTSSLPQDCDIASADCYATSTSARISSYAPYASTSLSAALPY